VTDSNLLSLILTLSFENLSTLLTRALYIFFLQMETIFFIYLISVYFNTILSLDTCDIVINELNSDDIGNVQFSEFIELKSVCKGKNDRPVLRNYLLIIIREYDQKLKTPVIIFSADFYRETFKPNSNFFVIGSPNVDLREKVDMPFTNERVMFEGKILNKPSQMKISSFFKKGSAPTSMNNAIDDGNMSPMAVILLKDENQDRDRNTGISKLRLTYDQSAHRTKTLKYLQVTPELEELIKNQMHDMIIYSRQSMFQRSNFFERLYSQLSSYNENYDLMIPAREWDKIGHEDMSLNRCPRSIFDLRKPFIFTQWKLGKRTPADENDCSGAKWILENALPDVQVQSIVFGADSSSEEELISETTSRADNRAHNIIDSRESQRIIQSRDSTIQAAHSQSSNVDLSNEERNKLYSLDQTCDRVRDLFTTLASIVDKAKAHEEPEAKRPCPEKRITECIMRPWEDTTHFPKAHEELIKKYQGRYISMDLISPARKTWLNYIFNAEDPSESKFQCRFCAKYVKILFLMSIFYYYNK
jgi:hypothetical protein